MSQTQPVLPEAVSRRFGDLQLLKAGSGVFTYLARSNPGTAPLVIKLAHLGSVGTAVAMRLAHEAEVLGRIVAPDGTPLLVDHGVDSECLWLAQRYQEGRTLRDRLREGPLGVDEVLAVGRDVLAHLTRAHEHDIVHRDVKPANVVVDEHGAVTRAALIDFGLARSGRLAPALQDVAVGTARYCSPEQAGLLDLPVDERSDLYSLGVTLFECAAGRPLFDGATVGEVLRQQLAPKPALTVVSTAVPRVLSEMVSRLTRTDPDRRYQTAAAALADVEDVIAARARGTSDPPLVIGRRDRRRALADPGFVGRGAELSYLEGELAQTLAGAGGLVFLEGESGAGKSRLLDEVARMAAGRGFLVLRGYGEDRTASRPFQIFDGVSADLADAAASHPHLAAHLRVALAERAAAVVSVAPQLRSVLGEGNVDGDLPEEHGPHRSVAALAALLDTAGAGAAPALIILDDCQWAETLTARVLTQWSADGSGGRVLIIAAFRADEVTSSSPLRTVPARRRLALGALADSDVRDLITSMAGPVPAPAADAVVRLAEGNAFMAQAVLRGLIESDVLLRVHDRWELNEQTAVEIQTSRQAALFLRRRLEVLGEAARSLLSAAAVVGKEADVDLAVGLSGLAVSDAIPALDELRRRRILWLDESRGNVRFSHDMLREAALERLSPEERSDLHMRAATHFLAAPESAPYQIAYHLDMAGLSTEAFPHAIEAAEAARSRHALEEAAGYYNIALKGAVEDASRFRIADGLGEVMSLSGDYVNAERYFTEAAALAPGPLDEAATIGKLGEVAFRRGDQVAAGRQLESALRKLGGRVPGNGAALIVALLWELVVQVAHSVTGNRVVRTRHAAAVDRLLLRFYSRLAYSYWFRNGRVRCLWAHLREMNMAERFKDPAAMAQAYSEHAPVMTMLPWYARGISYAERSFELRRGIGDVWGQGQSLNFRGVALYAASRYRESVEAFEESIRILAITGDRWEMNTGLWNLALAHYRLGEWARASSTAADLYQSATAIGDRSSAGISLAVVARATSGTSPSDSAIEVEATRRDEDQHTAAEVQLARGLRLLANGQAAEAAQVIGAAWSTVHEAGLRQEYVAPLLPWWATALRAALEAEPASGRHLARTQRKVARKSLRLARHYRNNLPHALREQALAELRAGRLRRARRYLDRSVQTAQAQEAAWEEAQSRLQRGRIGRLFDWPGAEEDLRRGQLDTARIEAAGRGVEPESSAGPTLALADRFAGLLDHGRRIAASTTVAGVMRAVEDGVTALLRSDHCFVIQIDPRLEPIESPDAPWSDVASRSTIREAVTSGAVVTRGGTMANRVTDSLVLAGVRSVICAPILRDGRVVACLYATHGEVDGLFGKDEEQVATFVATLAGAALEHVAGSEAYFRSLVEHSHDVTIVLDDQGRAIYVSPSVTRILGYPADAVHRRHYLDLVQPDDVKVLTDDWAASVASPSEPRTAEIRIRHADGEWRWMDLTLSNRLGDPNVLGMVLNLRDATDRRRSEVDLARAAERFRLAFDHAPIGMALVDQKGDATGRILTGNDALAVMLGMTTADLSGKSIDQYVHPADQHVVAATARAFAQSRNDVGEGQVRLRHVSGSWLWVRYRAALIRTDTGQPDYFIAQLIDVTDQRAAEEKLVHQALHDPLTGLPNRRLFLERLQQALARAERIDKHVAVLFLDLDRFKVINDSYGHATGDLVLVEAGRRLQELTRTSDTLGRLGGDEFVVLAEDIDTEDEAHAIAERIEQALSGPMTISPDIVVSVTTSIGITVARPGDRPAALLRDADTALYRAKERGRARHEMFDDDLRVRAIGRMSVESELRAAIDDERLVVLFDPIVDLHDSEVVGADARLHFRSRSGELIGPDDFMAVGEETGLVVPMGAWLLRAAAQELARWQEHRSDGSLRVSVRISARQLLSAGFTEMVASVLEAAGLKAGNLTLQVHELALSGSLDLAARTLAELRDIGCQIAISGFGAGYSSLALVRRLPTDYLAIDASFVQGIGSIPEDETIVEAIIRLAESLDVRSVAEGVQSRLQERVLDRLGCSLAKGPHFGAALTIDQLLRHSSAGTA